MAKTYIKDPETKKLIPVNSIHTLGDLVEKDHSRLGNRDKPKQHPIGAIDGLQEALDASAKIDDEKTVADKVWSSEKTHAEDDKVFNQAIEATCPPFEKTGPVVTCNPVKGYPLHVISKIDVKQEGSGDPSPSNVRPIVTTDKVELTRCGKSCGKPKLSREGGCSLDDLGERGYHISGNFNGFRNIVVSSRCNPTVVYTAKVLNPESIPDGVQIRYATNSVDGVSRNDDLSNGVPASWPGTTYARIVMNSSHPIPVDFTIKCQIVVGEFPDSFIPYTGETFTAQLPPDTYGGEVDWENGEMKSPFELVEFDGSENWGFNKLPSGIAMFEYRRTFEGTISGTIGRIWSNMFTRDTTSNGYNGKINVCAISEAGYPRFYTAEQSLESWKSFLAEKKASGTPVVMVIADKVSTTTPITPSGTPASLPGVNTLYSDTGDTTVSGREDPIATIEALTQRVTALENSAEPLPEPTPTI